MYGIKPILMWVDFSITYVDYIFGKSRAYLNDVDVGIHVIYLFNTIYNCLQ